MSGTYNVKLEMKLEMGIVGEYSLLTGKGPTNEN